MKKGRKITDLLALVVFAVFSLCILGVLLTGAGAYRKLVQRGENAFSARTGGQYVITRVRQAEDVALEDFAGCPALVLTETVDGEVYRTRIYCYEGWLRELYSPASAELGPEDGEKVLQAEEFSCILEDRLLTVRMDSQEMALYLPVGRLVVP